MTGAGILQPISRICGQAARRVAEADVAIMFMGSTLLTPLYVVYRETFGFSELTLTLIYATYVIGNFGALFLLGRLSDQIGRRRVTLWAVGAGAISTLVFLSAAGTPWLFAGRALSGLAIGLASGAGTAWIAELTRGRDRRRASVAATGANFVGIGTGALLAGVLAQYAPAPLRWPFVIYLLLLAAIAILMARSQETIQAPVHSLQQVSLRPRIGIPADIRAQFVSPALTAFATFSLLGFYIALGPSLLRRDLDIDNLAAAGAIVFELGVIAALSVYATGRFRSRTAMQWGLSLLVPSAAFLVAAQTLESLTLLLIGTALSGIAAALGYRGSLEVVNELAPDDKRAEVISSYQIVCYLGNSLPVIGVGVVSAISTPNTATISLAGLIAALAVAALNQRQSTRPAAQSR